MSKPTLKFHFHGYQRRPRKGIHMLTRVYSNPHDTHLRSKPQAAAYARARGFTATFIEGPEGGPNGDGGLSLGRDKKAA